MSRERLPKNYNPADVEDRIYDFWMKENLFHAEVETGKEPFCIVIPPPNVTGSLHMGHALDNTLQDILIRWKRMQGYEALWLPGMDHAGIATQIKVEEQLAKEGLSRHDLGREAFIDRVWEWKEKYGGQIINQLKRLGASCDWERQRFTMDEGLSEAVKTVFLRLYEKGLIYRGDYIINWCPRCKTALSDLEVEHQPTAGKLYHVRYPLEDGSGHITVATTRPETILGDTAVAVHPDDERYREVVGKRVVLPVLGRVIPIVADEYVDPEFGSGAVKVTPAHDPNDFEIGARHGLESVTVIDEDGIMTDAAGKYAGMERYQCREALLKDLEEGGYLVKVDDHEHAVGRCQRCQTVVEPLVSKQWFVKMKPLARPAIEAVKEGRVRFVPERFKRIYLNWMEKVHDWCISRQIWWGHRIPVWYCQDCGETIAAAEEPDRCPKCASSELIQDPDVLDTWFSSALWPFSTMGWPEDTPELRYFYPTSVLVTGYDIIFFWVARMIFSALEHTGQVPFRDVLIHGIVRDEQGRKMSKSLGNGIDPLEVIDKYGADTLRFTLVTGNAPGNDMRFYWERVEGSRNFCNKIWNASRFVLMNLEGFDPEMSLAGNVSELPLVDRWILSRLRAVAAEVTQNLERYELGEAARLLYDFIWSEYCDWYIELVKPRLYGKDVQSKRMAQFTLWYVLDNVLRLLHPFMPFITEEIWQRLPGTGKSLMVADWPVLPEILTDEEAEEAVAILMETVKAIRNLRAEVKLSPSTRSRVVVKATASRTADLLRDHLELISELARATPLEINTDGEPPSQALASIIPGAEVYLPLRGLVDIDREIARLGRDLAKARDEFERSKRKLEDRNFVKKAPPEIVAREREKLAEYREKISGIEERLRQISG